MSESFPPSRVHVLTPMRTIKKPRGRIKSDNADPQRTVRISDADIQAIDAAAALLDVTRSEFIRWVAYASANEFLRLHRESRSK